MDKFTDSDSQMRPVEIKCFDGGWILKEDEGDKFFQQLSETTNMDYFKLDTIKMLIMF